MGLLDDAIREHLELKRRRGADPAEVARAEQEALGPVRREPEHAPVQDSVHEEPDDAPFDEAPAPHDDVPAEPAPSPRADAPAPAPADAPAPDPGPDTFAPEEQTRILAPHERPAAAQPPAAEPGAAEPRPAAPADPRDHLRADQPPHAEPGVHPLPESESATPPHGDPARDEPVDPRHSDIVHQPTTEWRVEDEDEPFADERPPADEAAASDEDVLEETPDFLQETPEHDRLWFEQRPPRDFDFDG
jgi:hypothetical protein